MNHQSTTQSVYDLMDGQVQQQDLARVVALVAMDGEARREWKVQQLVGESMRRGAQLAVPVQSDLAARVLARIANAEFPAPSLVPTQIEVQVAATKEAANASWFDWRKVAGFALFALVGSAVWLASGPQSLDSGAQLAQQNPQPVAALSSASSMPSPGVVSTQTTSFASATTQNLPVMIRDPHLDALMAAHKQFGGTSALQKPAGFVRNATFEGPAR